MTRYFLMGALALTFCNAGAQTSAPTTVQTLPAANIATLQPAAATGDSAEATLKALQALKAANDAMLKKQEETLRQLAEMEKASEQLKVFSGRF